jgi:glycosyltransferase involved in cell wall biosynthesis
MNIVHVTECLAGGVLTFLVNLTGQLKEQNHIIIYGKRDNTPENVAELFGPNVQLIYWKTAQREIRPGCDLKALFELLHDLKNIPQIDILQLHSSKAGVLGRVAARLLGLQKRTFYLPHGVAFARKDVSANKREVYILAEKIANWFAGTVIACSQSEKELMEQQGISNIVVINNGIPVPDHEPEYKHPVKPLVFGTTGRITYQKNPELFNAIARKFRGNPNVKFLWIGDGELRNVIETADNVQVTGWVNGNQVGEYLKKIDVYLSTALWEGLPLSVLEAMALGKPLLLHQCVGNVDLVEENVDGYGFVDCKSAIDKINLYLTMQPDQYQKQAKNSFAKLKNEFSLEQMKSSYLKLYERNFSTKS